VDEQHLAIVRRDAAVAFVFLEPAHGATALDPQQLRSCVEPKVSVVDEMVGTIDVVGAWRPSDSGAARPLTVDARTETRSE